MKRSGAVVLGILFLSMGSQAKAQWGWGWGMGWRPSPETNYMYDRALVGASRAQGPSALRAPQGGQLYRGRDPEYFERYDVDTRRSVEDQIRPRRSSGTTTSPSPSQSLAQANATPKPAPAEAAPLTPPVLPLASFFNKKDELVWPAEAPVTSDFVGKKITSDQASLAVLKEQRDRGQATLPTVSTARTALLDYGRPALQYVREHTTARLADTFHMFLLSLYESLAQAANPPAKASAAKP